MSVRSEVVRVFNELLAEGKKITELPAGTTPVGDELIEGVQNGQSVSFNVAQIATGGVGVLAVIAGTNVTVDNTDPQNPIVSSSGGGGGGTVSSVSGLSPLFTVADPTGAAVFILVNQNANLVYAGPSTGVAAAPSFRSLVAADIPDLSAVYQPALSGTGFVKISGTTISYDNSTYLTGNQSITLSSEASGTGTTGIAVTLSNSAVIGKVLTGFTSGSGTITAADSILSAIQKLDGNITAGGGVTSVSGTTNRITSSGGATPVIDISASYVGQASITTVGTIGTGTWNATTISVAKGGTGLTALGTAFQYLRTNTGATALEYASLPFVRPEDYGAVGNGSTNDAAAFVSAFASGFAIYGDNTKNYRINTSITVPDDIVFIGNGCTVSCSVGVIHPFVAGNRGFYTGINFDGTNAALLGINITAVYRNHFTDCTFKNYTYAGMYVVNTAGAADYEGGVRGENCYFENNTAGTGLFLYTQAEFNNFSNCHTRGNTFGLQIKGGNNTWTGGSIVDNTTAGVELITGANDGHGSVTGALINHNAINVRATNIVNGFLFANNNMYAGNITIVTSASILFKSNLIGGTPYTITQTNNTGTVWDDNTFVTDYTFTTTGTGQKYFNNTFQTGTVPLSVVNSLVGPSSFSATTITATNPWMANFTGTATTTATAQQALLVNYTITTRATASDNFASVRIAPSITAGAATQTLYALFVDGSGILTTNTPTKWGLGVDGGALIQTGGTSTATNTLQLSTVNTHTIFNIVSNGTSVFSVGNTASGTNTTIIGAGTSTNGLAIAGTLLTSGGGGAMIALNGTQTAGANSDSLRVLRGFNTFGINTRTGVLGYFAHFNPTVTVSTGNYTLYGFVADGTLSSQVIRNGFNAGATPSAQLHIGPGTTAAGTAPIKLTSGTNNTTAETGAIEYNGTNLFFTRSGTTREGVLTQSAVTTEVIVSDTSVTVNIGGTVYKLLARA